jgi:hypothetical protein
MSPRSSVPLSGRTKCKRQPVLLAARLAKLGTLLLSLKLKGLPTYSIEGMFTASNTGADAMPDTL